MSKEPERVELIPAYSWDCPSCGRQNFKRGIVYEMSPEERAEICAENGWNPDHDGDLMAQPKRVTCRHCRARFETVHYGDLDP